MRIVDSQSSVHTQQAVTAAKADARNSSQKAAEAATSATRVTLSARARQLSDTKRLDSLREQVKSGTLKIDAKAIASKLVGDP